MTRCQLLLKLTAVPLAVLLGGSFNFAQEPSGLQAAAALESVLIDAIAKAERSVVAIARIREADGGIADEGQGRDATQPDFVPDDFGSGVVIDAKGLILTNYHVLGDLKSST